MPGLYSFKLFFHDKKNKRCLPQSSAVLPVEIMMTRLIYCILE